MHVYKLISVSAILLPLVTGAGQPAAAPAARLSSEPGLEARAGNLSSSDDLQSFERAINGRLTAIRKSAAFNASGRLVAFQQRGEMLTAVYEGEKLVAVRVGERTLKLAYAVSERTRQVDALVVSGADGKLINVVKGAWLGSSSLPLADPKILATSDRSSEQLKAELSAQLAAERSAVSDRLKGIRYQDSTDCDAMRDFDNARCDHAYEQEMVIVDLVRAGTTVAGFGAPNLAILASMLAARASDNKYQCLV